MKISKICTFPLKEYTSNVLFHSIKEFIEINNLLPIIYVSNGDYFRIRDWTEKYYNNSDTISHKLWDLEVIFCEELIKGEFKLEGFKR